jgi:hypothetical protein
MRSDDGLAAISAMLVLFAGPLIDHILRIN